MYKNWHYFFHQCIFTFESTEEHKLKALFVLVVVVAVVVVAAVVVPKAPDSPKP